VQGTGGVSVAALQLAVAVGATVIATTSSEEKAGRLQALGAAHVINYRTNAKNWCEEARRLTPDGRGLDFVIDVGGNETLPQSLAAVRVDGIIVVIGGVGSTTEVVPLFAALLHTCIIRGILAASRNQFRELVEFIDEKKILPAVDDVIFELAETKGAYRRLKDKKHFSKVLIQVD
jgi:NADPH:quinone reductase-like Zn-dependent oxidoreductase